MAESEDQAERGEILLVEDEKTLAGAIRYTLQREGYNTLWAADGAAALKAFRSTREAGIALVLLDLMLPVIDGLEVCRAIRQESSVPIMMLTAKTSEIDVVLGLELGADDYLAKPFGMRELVARVRALLRRAAAPAGGDRPIMIGPIKILAGQRRVLRDGVEVPLRPREFDLLLFLARSRGHVFTRDQLLEKVWGFDFLGESRTVDVHVRQLRTKLEVDPANPILLQTVRHVGYCLA